MTGAQGSTPRPRMVDRCDYCKRPLEIVCWTDAPAYCGSKGCRDAAEREYQEGNGEGTLIERGEEVGP